MAGLIKKRQNQFSLTRIASRILERQDYGGLYRRLLETHVGEYNWGFADTYDECPLIQQQALFGLYVLRSEASGGIAADGLCDLFLRAFPRAVEQCEPRSYSTPEERVKDCYRTRFLDRFATEFGLVDTDPDDGWLTNGETRYRTTDLFRRLLRWRI